MPTWVQVTTSTLSLFTGLFGIWLGQRIAQNIADKKWRLDQKLNVYRLALEAMNEYLLQLADAEDGIIASQNGLTAGKTLNKSFRESAGSFHSAFATAPLFISAESIKILESVKSAFSYHSSMSDTSYDAAMDQINKAFEALSRARQELRDAAKRDLEA